MAAKRWRGVDGGGCSAWRAGGVDGWRAQTAWCGSRAMGVSADGGERGVQSKGEKGFAADGEGARGVLLVAYGGCTGGMEA